MKSPPDKEYTAPCDIDEIMKPPCFCLSPPDPLQIFTPPQEKYFLAKPFHLPDKGVEQFQPTIEDGETIYLGLDAEWISTPSGNKILSWQAYCIHPDGRNLAKVYYPSKPGGRFTLERFLSLVIEDCLAAGIVDKWPGGIIVCAHFLRADLTTFKSFWGHKARLSGHGGSVVGRVLTGSEYGVDETALRSKRAHREPIILRDKHRRPRKLIIDFVDTLFLAPNKSPLSALGVMIDLPKIEIPSGYSIERMDLLLAGNKSEYERYALRDAELTVKYAIRVLAFLKAEFKIEALPRSLGAVGVQMFKRLIKELKIDFMSAFGLEITSSEKWNTRTGKAITRRVTQATPSCRMFESLATECYLGGRNESYMLGPTPTGDWFDLDLRGAYTTALCDMHIPDYPRAFMSTRPHDYCGHVMGFAYLRFQFPENSRFPCLPVRSEQYGLRFPLRGEAYVTAPEIELALSMGADIEIFHGVIVPWVENSPRLFEPFTRMIQKRRKDFARKSLEEVMIKEIGNSLYGKLAQGLSGKSAFDTATGLSKRIGPSAVTNAYMAAHTTGLIRAVCGELLHRIPSSKTVISVTTDGFLTDTPLNELDQSGPLCRRYQALCQLLHGDECGDAVPMLELKHHARQIVSIKTRGQCTAIQGDTPPVLAKAGVKCPGTIEEQNAAILDLYLRRETGQKVNASHIISLREQWLTESDLIEIQKEVRLNYEFDQKRKLINPRMVDVAGMPHLACDTAPWSNSAEADYCRARFDGWRENSCLKTMEDWNSWDDVYESATALQGSKMRVCEDGSLGILSRILTRSLVQKAWFNHDMSYTEIAALLVSVGLAVSVDTCKNSKRSKLYEHVVPVTAPVIQVLARLVRQVPDLPLAPLFKPERLEEVHRRLAAIQPGVSNDEK